MPTRPQIQKGILQVCKGLSFLHTSARTIHTNLTPESILINSAVSETLHPRMLRRAESYVMETGRYLVLD